MPFAVVALPPSRHGDPKTQVPTPNLGHPPSLITSTRVVEVISSPRLPCQCIPPRSARATRQRVELREKNYCCQSGSWSCHRSFVRNRNVAIGRICVEYWLASTPWKFHFLRRMEDSGSERLLRKAESRSSLHLDPVTRGSGISFTIWKTQLL